MIRTATARILAPLMAVTGFRFGKSFRRGDTLGHRIVRRLVDTVEANWAAHDIKPTADELAEWAALDRFVVEAGSFSA